MAKVQKQALCAIKRQPDTFHGIAYQLGIWNTRLEKKAFQKIVEEDNRYSRIDTVKSDHVLIKKIKEYEIALSEADIAISVYDQFVYLYQEIIKNLLVFDSFGNLNNKSSAKVTITTALSLMEELKIPSLTKAIKKIQKLLPELLSYLDEAKSIVDDLSSLNISGDVLCSFCLSWQYGKNWIKSKNTARRRYYKDLQQEELSILMQLIDREKYENIKNKVYSQLDRIIQSSAVIENINSIIRMYLNTTKNHISQNYLNLIMFYLNHRRFHAGKRKRKTPMEMLTEKGQTEDWMELLLRKIDIFDFPFSLRDPK